ncbi:MAG TPA: hypothetical protein VNL35_09945 [Chloroflexota bacterium]|nr:hypothetical protein [Chloroflexota bacterium]
MSAPNPLRPAVGSVRRQRLVLLALFAPFVGIGLVLWLLLPGGAAAPSYSTIDFRHETALRPDYWTNHTAAIHGYLYPLRCQAPPCEPMVLTGRSVASGVLTLNTLPLDSILVGPQPESAWHADLRHLLPGWLASPLTTPPSPGKWTTVTGSIAGGYRGSGPPALIPVAL